MTKAWKHTEDVFAKALGLKRVIRTDWSSEAPDCYNDYFVAEAKERKQGFPKLIEKAFEQAERYAQKLNKEDGKSRIPIVGLHRWATRDYYVVIKLDDFVKIIKDDIL